MNEWKADLFAEMAHSSIHQKRKYTGYPYISHPRNVAYLVKIIGGSLDMICAAYLHDVLEDVAPKNSLYSEDRIEKEFNSNVLTLVKLVTDISKPENGNREIRKTLDRQHIALAHPEAKTIKLADLIDNSLTIVEYDKDFAEIYLKEKRLLLSVLKEGDQYLWNIANNILIKNGY